MRSDFAMVTKARTLHSKHLNANHYRDMLRQDSVSDVAVYLKNETRYRDVLEGINEKGIHRDYLESRIRLKSYIDFTALLRYVHKDNHRFYQFFIKEIEIKQIVAALYAIQTHSRVNIARLPTELNHLISFDLEDLARAETVEDVRRVVHSTDYGAVFDKAGGASDVIRYEDALKRVYYQSMLEVIRRDKSAELLDIFRTKIELDNIIIIYRLKKYFDASAFEILARITIETQNISKRELLHWIHDLNAEEVLLAFQASVYKRFGSGVEFEHIEHYCNAIQYRMLLKKMRFSQQSDVVLYAYVFLISIEIENIINVIEGTRYNLNADRILEMLIV